MTEEVVIYIPDDGFPTYSFRCPDCGFKITSPFGGHTWTCHEDYGGCGAQFRPEKGFKRVEET